MEFTTYLNETVGILRRHGAASVKRINLDDYFFGSPFYVTSTKTIFTIY